MSNVPGPLETATLDELIDEFKKRVGVAVLVYTVAAKQGTGQAIAYQHTGCYPWEAVGLCEVAKSKFAESMNQAEYDDE